MSHQSIDLNLLNRTYLKEHPVNGAENSQSEELEETQSEERQQEKKNLTIDEWIKTLNGGYAIPDGDPILAYAETTGLTTDLLIMAWEAFLQRYRGTENRQVDWRAWYRRFVKENWGRLWTIRNGEFELTTVGEQLQLEVEEKFNRDFDVYQNEPKRKRSSEGQIPGWEWNGRSPASRRPL